MLTLDLCFGVDTPIARLASEGKFQAVKLMLKLGASKDRAVEGAAQGGHMELVEKLIREGASKEKAAKAAESCGHNELSLYLKDYAGHFFKFPLKTLERLSVKQRMAWKNLRIADWLLCCFPLVENGLPLEMYCYIARSFSGDVLTDTEVLALQSTMFYLIVEQQPLLLALDKQLSLASSSQDNKCLAKEVKASVLEATNTSKLLDALKTFSALRPESTTTTDQLINEEYTRISSRYSG